MADYKVPSETVLNNLRRLFVYDAETGILRWADTAPRYRGCEAGGVERLGYRRVTVAKRHYLSHRIAWFLATGEWPRIALDHINGDTLNNRLANLRLASPLLNAHNKHGPLRNSKTGVLGVTLCKQTGLYRAQIMARGKAHSLGRFPTIEQATRARLAGKQRLHEAGRL